MFRTFYAVVLLAVALLISCEEEQKVLKDPTTATETLTVKLKPFIKKEVSLSAPAQSYLMDIEEYALLRDGVQSIDQKTVAEVKSEIDGWSNSALQLYKKMQDSLLKQPVTSRILLIYTKSRLLRQELAKTQIDTAAINVEATEMFNAFQDLNNQFNVKFLQSVDDFLEEFRENGTSQQPLNKNGPIFRPNVQPARVNLRRAVENESLPEVL
ncbi:MAG: hypothetical protein WBG71_04480 [Leeuwenhoekiella sp.]